MRSKQNQQWEDTDCRVQLTFYGSRCFNVCSWQIPHQQPLQLRAKIPMPFGIRVASDAIDISVRIKYSAILLLLLVVAVVDVGMQEMLTGCCCWAWWWLRVRRRLHSPSMDAAFADQKPQQQHQSPPPPQMCLRWHPIEESDRPMQRTGRYMNLCNACNAMERLYSSIWDSKMQNINII